MDNITDITLYLRRFAKLRDWEQFHSPKNLSMALSIECAELMEHFQWLTEDASQHLDDSKKSAVAEEIVDVLLYAIRLADIMGVDIATAISQKTQKNEAKYPVDKVKGNSKKYSEYE
jgi:NTP pyrophosphatase (non-canonical NTP hydrolase)